MKSPHIFIATMALLFAANAACAATQKPKDINTQAIGESTPLSGAYIGVYGGYDWSDMKNTAFNGDPRG